MGFLFGSKPDGRHKPTLKELAAERLDRIAAYGRSRREEGRADSERRNREFHEQDHRDRLLDAGRHSEHGNATGGQSHGESQEQQRRHQQMLEDERERQRQFEQEQRDNERRQQMEREQQRW